MDRIASWALGSAWLLTIGGCGGIPLDPEAPPEFDLNGHWVINRDLSDPPPDERRLQAEADRALLEMGRERRPRRMGMLAFVTADFKVLSAKSMVIEQDAQSMGIRYAGGGYRDVSWGKRRRGLWEVNAGWTQDGLVIVSRADDASATETMRLRKSGRQLAITVEIKSAGDALIAVRVFDRVSGD